MTTTLLTSCFGCLRRPAVPPQSVSAQPGNAELLTHKDLVGLLWNGNDEQKAWAAQRVTRDAGGSDPETAAMHRHALLLLDVIEVLQAMLSQSNSRIRAAAAQALCNLALEAAAGTNDALAACPQPPERGPPWHLLYEALPTLVPSLRALIASPPGAPHPEGPAALPAAQALSNLMRGAAFVSRTLPLLGPLPALVLQLAPTAGPDLKQQVSQMLLNAALHGGTASVLDAAEAPKALLLLLHQEAPPGAHERCLCTLYNMLRGEEGSARRAADIMAQPLARQALCTQLYKDQPNCRFLSACLLMCMLRCAAENASEAEWGPSGSDQQVEPSGSVRTPRRRRVRRSEAYRRLVAELGGSGSLVLTAVQHALDSALGSTRTRREFAYGRREQLLQALVAGLHALCTMDEQPPAAGATVPESARRAVVSGSTPRRQQATNASTNSGLSRGSAVSGSAGQAQPSAARLPMIDQLGGAAVSALLQLLPVGGASQGAAAAAAAAGADAALMWACLSMVSLMTTSTAARKALLAAKHPGALTSLSALITSVRAFSMAPGLASTPADPVGAAARGTPAAGSASATPRLPATGNSHRAVAASRAAAAMRDVAAAYLGPGGGSSAHGAAAGAAGSAGRPDPGLAWGRCQALAAKALRNLVVTEPGAALQQRVLVPSLLLALYGPARLAALVTVHNSQQQMPAALAPQPPQLVPAPPQQLSGDGLAPPVPSLTPRPRPSLSPRPSGPLDLSVEPEWSREVQRHAVASLVYLLVTARGYADAACAAVVEAGGIPVIAEVMKAAASAVTASETAGTYIQQHHQQLAAWCAVLLGRLYVSSARCQTALADALLAPSARRADVLALLHLLQQDHMGGAGVGVGSQLGPMYKSLHKRGGMGPSNSTAGGMPAVSVANSVATLRSAQPSETGAYSSGPGTPAGGGREEVEAAALAAGLDEAGAGAVVRLSPVMEGERAGKGVALAAAVGRDGDLLASTAGSRPAALAVTTTGADHDSEDVLRTSTRALRDLLSASPGGGVTDAAMRRSRQQQRMSSQQSDELRSSVGVQSLAMLMRSTAGAPGGGIADRSTGAQAATAADPRAEGSSSSGGFSGSTATGLDSGAAAGSDEVGHAAASEEAMRQLEQWLRHCRPSFLDDAASPEDAARWGPLMDEDGTGSALPALEYA